MLTVLSRAQHLGLCLCRKHANVLLNSVAMVGVNVTRNVTWGSLCPEERYMVGDPSDDTWMLRYFNTTTQPLDLSLRGVRRFIKRQMRVMEYEKQRFSVMHRNTLTPDLAAMSFVILLGGQTKCEGQTFWVHSMRDHEAIMPLSERIRAKLEAVNLSYTEIMYHGLENLEGTPLKWLSLKNCRNIDDWCINRIAVEFRDSLEYLDVSGCPRVSYRGLASLHKTRKLRTLVMRELPKMEHGELVTIMMSEMLPACDISGYFPTIPPEEEMLKAAKILEESERDKILQGQQVESGEEAETVEIATNQQAQQVRIE